MSEEGKKDKDEDKGASLKELTLAPALTALLKPAAEYLGLELRDCVKSFVEDRKEKRRARNLNAHINAVNKKLEKHPPASPADERGLFHQLTIFDEWMSNVQDVDPTDEELSSLWQSLLAMAARGERIPSEVMSVLKTLSPKEAQLLVMMMHRPLLNRISFGLGGENKYLSKSLEAKQILERNHTIVVAMMILTIIVAPFAYSALAMLWDTRTSVDLLLAMALSVCCVAAAYYAKGGLAHWRLTWLGKELLSYVSRAENSGAHCAASQSTQADSPGETATT